MKVRAIILGALLGVTLLAGCSAAAPSSAKVNPSDAAAVVEGNNAFVFDLYGEIASGAGNLFLSPFSISSALAMTYAGARGETARQMEKTLHFDLAAEKINPGFSELLKRFNASDKSYALSVANALWGQKGIEFRPEFMETMRKYYDAGFMEVDYARDAEKVRRTINDWVEGKTKHKIVDLIAPGAVNSLTRLVLTNAIYFKGRWESPFDPKQTKDAPFLASSGKKTTVPLMHQAGEFKYAEIGELQLLELPYSGGDVVMDVLLPKSNSGMAEMENTLKPTNLVPWLAAMTKREVSVFLPRFKLEKGFSLGKTLQSMGMKDAFNPNTADFSGMSSTPLSISEVVHKAFVEVNEEGTEAAAATAVIMRVTGVPMAPPVFRADHPFIFLIRDVQSGSILFMGRMANPQQ